jgi:hypothetical protein
MCDCGICTLSFPLAPRNLETLKPFVIFPSYIYGPQERYTLILSKIGFSPHIYFTSFGVSKINTNLTEKTVRKKPDKHIC